METLDHTNSDFFQNFAGNCYFITLTLEKIHHSKKLPGQIKAIHNKIKCMHSLLDVKQSYGSLELTKKGKIHYHGLVRIDIDRCLSIYNHETVNLLENIEYSKTVPIINILLSCSQMGIFDVQIPKSLPNVIEYINKDVKFTSQIFANLRVKYEVIIKYDSNAHEKINKKYKVNDLKLQPIFKDINEWRQIDEGC